MIIDIPTAVETVAGVTTAIGAVWTSVRHMQNAAKLRKEKEKEHILALAKEEIDNQDDLTILNTMIVMINGLL